MIAAVVTVEHGACGLAGRSSREFHRAWENDDRHSPNDDRYADPVSRYRRGRRQGFACPYQSRRWRASWASLYDTTTGMLRGRRKDGLSWSRRRRKSTEARMLTAGH